MSETIARLVFALVASGLVGLIVVSGIFAFRDRRGKEKADE